MTTPIAFLGTGLLGAGFVEAALGRGESVQVWNRTRTKAEPLAALGATVYDKSAEAVRGVSRVHLVLQDDASVDAVIEALRPGLGADVPIVDHTTTRPDLTASRAARLSAAGVRYLHCPVFIGPPGARKAEGVMLACGPHAWFDAVHPALARQASRIEYLGERADIAAAFKLAGNALLLGITGLVSDTVTVLDRAGVPGADIAKLLEYLNPSHVV
ncbi:MAG: NAD(P)-dependent oxidoreductase, partial [Planctomycetes bacterium]|nr:NAD(P)-dependent oxidoreductase [Planctomycetota bacterium]